MVRHIKNKPRGLFIIPIIIMLMMSVFVGMVSAETLEVAHYTFNETSGTTLTDIAGSNDGANNGATINQTGKIGKAYSFDGVNDYILINNLNQNSRTRSINIWFKLNSSNAFDAFFWAYSDEGTKGMWCRSEDSTSTTRCTYDNDVIATINRTSEYDDDQWHMLTYIINNTSQKLYIDGVDKNSTSEITTSFNINDLYLGSRNGDLYADVFFDDTRIYNFALNSDDISLIYNSGHGTETPLNELRSGEIKSTISNPSAPIYPTVSYDWNAGYIDADYNSDYTYEYSFGFNDTNSFGGNQIYEDTNVTLDYDQNTIKYFDLDYKPTTNQIGDTNYSFFTVHTYLDSTYDSNETVWSAHTFTVAENIVFDFNAPDYPDWANIFYPTKSYSGLAHYEDKSFQTGVTTYKYDLGSNDTNSFDGAEEFWKQNIDINSIDGNVNAYFEHTISVADKGKTLFAFLTMKRYYNDVFIDSNTEWTASFDINYGRFRTQFYDENYGVKLDGNVMFENTLDIPVDANGLSDIWLENYIVTDGQAIALDAWREVAGVVTHTSRNFDYYLYLTQSYDFNVALLPIDLGANIEFLVKDLSNNLWANKYLMFIKATGDICAKPQTLITDYTADQKSDAKRGVMFGIEQNCYLSSIDIEQHAEAFDSWELWNYTMGTLLDYGTGVVSTDTRIKTSTAMFLDTNYEYSIVFYNDDGSDVKFMRNDNYLTTPVVTDYISYNAGCKNGAVSCSDNDAFSVLGLNVIDASDYMAFFKEPIIEIKKLDSEGKGIYYLVSDGNYSAVLIDEMGSLITQYQKTTVNLKKPKDEITKALISPYDVDVGGLLIYSLTNQTASDINFNVFAGTTDYYDFTVVDYNTSPVDRMYIPRRYVVRVPFGTNYTGTYDLQPYLITDVDGIIPQVKIIDQLNRAVNDAVVIVYKYISGEYSVVESAITDSTGSMSWSAYPLAAYTIAVYYNEELKGTYVLRPRTSDDVYYIKIELSEDEELTVPNIFQINWGDTKEFVNVNSEHVRADNVVIANSKSNITAYTAYLYQGNTLIDSDSNAVDNASAINVSYTFDDSTLNKSYHTATIKIIVEYGDGETKEFVRIISVSGREHSPVEYFKDASNDLGQPLSAIIAIFLTGLMIAMLSFSGLPLGKTGIAVFGMFVLSVFVWLGWLDSGVSVLGFDVSRFMFILVTMAITYFMFKESVR